VNYDVYDASGVLIDSRNTVITTGIEGSFTDVMPGSGVNDGDGLRNSVVADSGGVATLDVIPPPVTNVLTPTDTASRSSGGSIGLIFLLLMPGLFLLNFLLRRNYRLPLYKNFIACLWSPSNNWSG
jgi:hypothetical protein